MKTKILFLGIFASIVISCNNKQDTAVSNLQLDENTERTDSANEIFKDSTKTFDPNYFIEQLDNTKGLSNSSVNTIFQDSEN